MQNKNKIYFERAIFISWYCSLGDCAYCYMSTQKQKISDPKKAKRTTASILAEAYLCKKLGWKIGFLSAGYGSYTQESILDLCKKVYEVYGEKLWLWLMREAVGPDMGVKAAGGVRDAMTVVRLIYAGAKEPELRAPLRFRIGTSGPLNILATMNWIRLNPQAWAEAKVIPCTICPHGQTSKQRREVREIYMKKCRLCPYRRYRKDKDF